jgi:hypothetical protein
MLAKFVRTRALRVAAWLLNRYSEIAVELVVRCRGCDELMHVEVDLAEMLRDGIGGAVITTLGPCEPEDDELPN